jgi:hypothetical protein
MLIAFLGGIHYLALVHASKGSGGLGPSALSYPHHHQHSHHNQLISRGLSSGNSSGGGTGLATTEVSESSSAPGSGGQALHGSADGTAGQQLRDAMTVHTSTLDGMLPSHSWQSAGLAEDASSSRGSISVSHATAAGTAYQDGAFYQHPILIPRPGYYPPEVSLSHKTSE